jgi:RimJ/RimL family protein N-acetyltransferase
MGSAVCNIIRERFDKGFVLWLLKENGHLAGYSWTIVNNHVTPTYIPHLETDAHIIGLEIFPKYRGGHIFRLFYEEIKIALKKEGSKRLYFEIFLYNKRAIKAFLKTSTRKIGIATPYNLFGKNVIAWHDTTDKTDLL